MISAVMFVLGFSTVFVALGASASLIGGLIRAWSAELSIVAGIVIIIMGLHFLGLTRIGLLMREGRLTAPKPVGLWGAYVMGLAFAFGWTPCIGPILAAILSVAASEATVTKGAGLLAVYSAGLGIPFLIAAFMVEQFSSLFARMKRHLATVERAMGVLMVLTGIGFLTGSVSAVSIWLLETFPGAAEFWVRRLRAPGRSAARSTCRSGVLGRAGAVTDAVLGTVPALRSGMKNAAPRPGHEIGVPTSRTPRTPNSSAPRGCGRVARRSGT